VVFCSLASSIDSLLAATSDLVINEFVKGLFAPGASEAQLRRLGSMVILGIGAVTWAFCAPRIGTLASVLFFAGPMVGSTIWPIIAGLYWRDASPLGAVLAMLLGSAIGLVAYFQLGWYTASLVGAAVSMVIVVASRRLAPRVFDWRRLDGSRSPVEVTS